MVLSRFLLLTIGDRNICRITKTAKMKHIYKLTFLKFFIITLLKFSILIIPQALLSQQDAQYTQYIYNTNVINPAYAGTRGLLNLTALNRSQWAGLEGSPETQTLNFNTPVGISGIGLGVSFINDNIGPSSEQLLHVDFSYQIQTSKTHTLSFGVKAGLNLLNVDFNSLQIFDPNDQGFTENINNRFTPNIGAGVYYFSDKWYLGLSVPNILETRHFDSESVLVARERQTFYLIAGYVFDLSFDWKFKPATLTKISSGTSLSTDISANFLYRERFTFGASYRLGSAVSALAGFQVNDAWLIGYSYDADTTGLAEFNGGSHEIFMRLEFNWFQSRRVKCPRFF